MFTKVLRPKHKPKDKLSQDNPHDQCGICNRLYPIRKSSKARIPVWKARCPEHEISSREALDNTILRQCGKRDKWEGIK